MALRLEHTRACNEKEFAPAYRDLVRSAADVKGMSHVLHLTIAAGLQGVAAYGPYFFSDLPRPESISVMSESPRRLSSLVARLASCHRLGGRCSC